MYIYECIYIVTYKSEKNISLFPSEFNAQRDVRIIQTKSGKKLGVHERFRAKPQLWGKWMRPEKPRLAGFGLKLPDFALYAFVSLELLKARNMNERLLHPAPPFFHSPLPFEIEFLLRTDSGYPQDAGVTTTWHTMGISFAIAPLGQLH